MARQISRKRLEISTAQRWCAYYDLTLEMETMAVVRWRQRLSDLVSVLTVIGTKIVVDVASRRWFRPSDRLGDLLVYNCINWYTHRHARRQKHEEDRWMARNECRGQSGKQTKRNKKIHFQKYVNIKRDKDSCSHLERKHDERQPNYRHQGSGALKPRSSSQHNLFCQCVLYARHVTWDARTCRTQHPHTQHSEIRIKIVILLAFDCNSSATMAYRLFYPFECYISSNLSNIRIGRCERARNDYYWRERFVKFSCFLIILLTCECVVSCLDDMAAATTARQQFKWNENTESNAICNKINSFCWWTVSLFRRRQLFSFIISCCRWLCRSLNAACCLLCCLPPPSP